MNKTKKKTDGIAARVALLESHEQRLAHLENVVLHLSFGGRPLPAVGRVESRRGGKSHVSAL